MRSITMFLASASLVAAVAPAAASAQGSHVHNGVGSSSATGAKAGPTSASLARGVLTDGQTTRITFDSPQGAPCLFDDTQALSDEYASVGVHFQGPQPGEGGAILSECAKFGVHARSGHEFLGFSSGTYAVVPETISFDSSVRRVTMYVANGSRNQSTYKLLGMRDGKVINRTVAVVKSKLYTGISVRANKGLDAVVFKATTPDQAFVMDDLIFRPIG